MGLIGAVVTQLISLAIFSRVTFPQKFYLDPRLDVPFKHLFGTPNLSEPIFARFVNDIMADSGLPKICDKVTFERSSDYVETIYHSETELDTLCTNDNYTAAPAMIVEVQLKNTADLTKRFQYYVASQYSGQLMNVHQINKENIYDSLKPALLLVVTNSPYLGRDQPLISHSRFMDIVSHKNYYPDMMISNFLLRKCRSKVKKETISVSDPISQWCYFFSYAGETDENVVPLWAQGDPVFEAAFAALKASNYTPDELAFHKRTMKDLDQTRMVEENAMRKGMMAGKKAGKKEVAMSMHEAGMSPEMIFNHTGINITVEANL